jgi:hypothetical protein
MHPDIDALRLPQKIFDLHSQLLQADGVGSEQPRQIGHEPHVDLVGILQVVLAGHVPLQLAQLLFLIFQSLPEFPGGVLELPEPPGVLLVLAVEPGGPGAPGPLELLSEGAVFCDDPLILDFEGAELLDDMVKLFHVLLAGQGVQVFYRAFAEARVPVVHARVSLPIHSRLLWRLRQVHDQRVFEQLPLRVRRRQLWPRHRRHVLPPH